MGNLGSMLQLIDLINFCVSLKKEQTIKLSQSVYIDKIFNKFYLSKATTINTFIKKTMLLSIKIWKKWQSNYSWKRKLSKNDRVHYIFHSRNKARYFICYLNCKLFCKKLWPPIYQSCKSNSLLFKRFERLKNHI